MRALVVREWTKFENLKVENDWAEPVVEPGTVKIRTQAVGINFALSLRVEGKYQIKPSLPHVPGIELCGYVTDIGPGVTGFKIGDRVASFVTYGACAEYCVAPAHRTHVLPDSIPFVSAVGYATSYMTAYAALVWPQWINLQFGETLVVTGAAGGVGLVAVDIAKILGGRVIALVGSESKAQTCREHGADFTINYRTEDVKPRIMEITGNEGVEAIFEMVGGDIFKHCLSCIAPEGRIVTIGSAGGTVPQLPLNILLMKNATLMGMNYGYYTGQWGVDPKRHKDMGTTFEPQVRQGMAQLFHWTDQGRLRPEISHVFPLDQVHAAMATVLDRRSVGRVALALDEEAKRYGFQ